MIILFMLMLMNVYISEMYFSIWILFNVDCVLCIMYACFADAIYCSFFNLSKKKMYACFADAIYCSFFNLSKKKMYACFADAIYCSFFNLSKKKMYACFADAIYCSFFPLACPFVVFSGKARNVV